MHIKDYFPLLSTKERERLAKACRVSYGHLRNVVYGAPISPELVARLEISSRGRVTRQAHFPETYTELWPELARKRNPKTIARKA